MAKPIKDRVPLTAIWSSIKSGNDTLKKSPMFKPDLLGPISKYDQALLGYTKQLTDKDKLGDYFVNMEKVISANEADCLQLAAAGEKLDKETAAKRTKYAGELTTFSKNPDADMNAVCAAITNFCAQMEEGVTQGRALADKGLGINKQRIAALNKIRDDYKTKSSAIATNMIKFERDVLGLEVQIRGIIGTYGKIALDMNHGDAGDAARELLAKF